MDAKIQVEIIDKESGQRDQKELKSRFNYFGSDPGCTVPLGSQSPGSEKGVAPKHLQVILETGGGQGCRAVNLSLSPIPVNNNGELAGMSAREIADGDQLSLGAYDLVFHMGVWEARPPTPVVPLPPAQRMGTVGGTVSVRLWIDLPRIPLSPEKPLDGWVHIRNSGTRGDVQVNLTLDGLPANRYQIGLAPLLYPGGEDRVALHIEHPAVPEIHPGACRIILHAGVEDQEVATATQDIQIAPFHKHELRLKRIL